ncbi:Helix-turn-helix domain-containing protein [Lachnospiraceae bacterium G11]|nr:Helix-turn-helix domain-containing protein [Lachnospiraceae bacterium G11]
MSIRNAGDIIREARTNAGLTQEELASGICSEVSLSNIENGKLGASTSTFKLLMNKAGVTCEAYPIFKNRDDFESYLCLRHIRFYLETWNLDKAYDELLRLRELNYCQNKYYYQEALFLYCLIQYKAGTSDVSVLVKLLFKSISISHPGFNDFDFRSLFLSNLDIEILLLMANIYIDLKSYSKALNICSQLNKQIKNALVTDKISKLCSAFYDFTYARFLFETGDYSSAAPYADAARQSALENYLPNLQAETLILQMLTKAATSGKNIDERIRFVIASLAFLKAGYLGHVMGKMKEFGLSEEWGDIQPDAAWKLQNINFDEDSSNYSDGTFDIYSNSVLTFGKLLSVLRKEQNLPMDVLCKGLCSKSKLSKIENGYQDPSIYLSEALLNRLGYSDRDFVFYGNKEEALYSSLRDKLLAESVQNKDTSNSLKNLEIFNKGKDEPVVSQMISLYKSDYFSRQSDYSNALSVSQTVLSTVYEGKSISQITSNFCLSWQEVTAINDIINSLIMMKDYDKAKDIISRLMLLAKDKSVDIHYAMTSFSMTYCLQARYLYRNNLFNNILTEFDPQEILSSPFHYSERAILLFYCCNAYLKSNSIEKAISIGRISCGFNHIIGRDGMANHLCSDTLNDYDIRL